MSDLKIQSGRFYRTRDGRKVGPIIANRGNEYWPWVDSSGDPKKKTGKAWDKQGKGCDAVPQAVFNPDLDLIAEWTDEPEAAPIDNASPLRRHAEAERPAPDYNDGKWHGWNGGECPVHLKTRADLIAQNGSMWKNAIVGEIGGWSADHCNPIVAFRVVTPYTAPREGYAVTLFRSAREAKTAHPGCDPIFVREVKE